MNICLFIDTNLYLRFYDTKEGGFRKLLKTLPEIKNHIFISPQIINEINRNKEELFIRSFNSYEKQLELTNTSLPDHIVSSVDEEIRTWNDERNKLKEQNKKSSGWFKSIRDKIL